MRRTAFAAPFLVGVTLLVLVPSVTAANLAFTDYYGFTAPEFTGWANLRRLMADDLFWLSLRNTLVIAAIVVPLRLALATGCALLLHTRGWTTGFGRTAVYLPAVVPDAAWALLWLWLFNPLYGPLPAALEFLGLPSPSWFTEPGPARFAIGLVIGFQLGEAFLVALAARAAIPPRLYEAAAIEGSRAWFGFRRITLPLMAPILGLLAFRDALLIMHTTFVPAMLLTDGQPYNATLTTPLYLYRRAFLYGELGYANTLSLALLALTALAVALQLLLLRRIARFGATHS